ncbi:glucan endo-1,3-beta-glucosidase-like isoform X2 [Spinacia oleracea]|uniref:Glucan endo-1,3-beta-glucosidase-like isoform X2 n=1 Tax=Spinacia oleracea TaxID=3562 RepID=A0A9R0J7L6_SPIOL|nr:glucan endo-1,3-beta-glucosidase-like isoform X2 [Spinacia oleracea]
MAASLIIPPMATASLMFIVAFVLLSLQHTVAQLGVCYGRNGNNLPNAQATTDLYNYYGIGAMRLYAPDQSTLQALQGTGIELTLGVPNEDIQCIACDQQTANEWVETNIIPYATSIKYIAVGNEIHPSDEPTASSLHPAMQNIQNAINSNNLTGQIKVSTAIDTSLIVNSYPPSKAEFGNLSFITPIIDFLTSNNSPLLVNIQPYTSYVNNQKDITLDFALFTACGTVFTDGETGKEYQNLFDAIYDAVFVAVGKVVGSPSQNGKYRKPPPRVVASESGWPSKGGFSKKGRRHHRYHRHHRQVNGGLECGGASGEAATPENAKMYYTNLIKHVKKGTPLTEGEEIETYLFAMFDEDEKPGDESERFYGLFTPDQQPKYGILDIC